MSEEIWFAYVRPALITVGAGVAAIALDRHSPTSLWSALFRRKHPAGK